MPYFTTSILESIMKNKVIFFFAFIFLIGIILTSESLKGKNLTSISKNKIYATKNRPQYMPGQIRIKFKQHAEILNFIDENLRITGISSVDEKFSIYEIQLIKKALTHEPTLKSSAVKEIPRTYTLYFDESKNVHKMAKAFADDPNIEYAEPVPINYIEIEPDDPQLSQQGHLTQIQMPAAWDIARGDSTIIIAIVDNGTDWEHIDLIDNIWTNQAEAEGLPGVDDDGNGYVDDIHGWDFPENDNNPTNQPENLYAYYHGTVTAGLASAITNNGILVSGVSWNCTIMPLKCGRDDKASEGIIVNWVDAIRYAANMGAHIINLSFGGFHQPSRFEQEEGIDYAYRLGALVVASAGNSTTSEAHYPSGYPHVLSVTWVNSKDILPNYGGGVGGTFGISVDISAPGVDLLSLNPGDGMIRMSGASSATPVVAGLAGLVKSQHPEWGPLQVMRQVVLTADNIDYLNTNHAGQIGSGRVNGFKAVSEMNPAEIPPRIQLYNISISDSAGGNNNMIFDRGEIIEVKTSYHNYSISPGKNVIFTLTTNDTDLTLINSTINGYFAPDTSTSLPGSFTFRVNDDAKGKTGKIFVNWQAEGSYGGADTFDVLIGKIPILIVDDDIDENADDYAARLYYHTEKMYTTILDQLGLEYWVWDRYKLGKLEAVQLSNFPIVIWSCDWAFPSLDSDDQLAISAFLDNGGSLFISGQDIGWDFNDPGGYGYDQRDFYTNYLHAVYYADASSVNSVVGVPGDPIGDGIEFTVWQPGLPAEYQFPDEIEPGPGATAVFEYTGGKNHKFGIKYNGDHKVIYFGMGLEAIDSEENTTPDDISTTRTEILRRVLDWLNFINHEPISDTENLTESRTIIAQVENSSINSDLVAMELHWKKEDDENFTIISMTDIGDNQYSAEIPGPGQITTIEYYIKMINSYFEWNSPQRAPDKFYSYYVGPDKIAPTFSHVPIKSSINGEEPRTVFVAVKDNIELDTSAVYLHYVTESISDSIRLTAKDIPGQFHGYLPAVFAYNDTVSYYFTAYDKAETPNPGQSAIFSFIVGYEDFESGLDNWIASPDGWGQDNTFANSGEYSINDSPNQSPYPNNRDVNIATNFGFDLSKTEHATLKFWTRVYLEIDHDFGYIEVSNDDGIRWNQVGSALNGFIGSWQQQTVSLSSYSGPGNTDVRIRFRMVSDATQLPPVPGWFIDDVQIIEGLNVTGVEEEIGTTLPDRFTLYQNYPNPFNPATTIRFDLPIAGHVTLKIFNIRGELVQILIQEQMNAGSHKIQWKGKDDRGQSLSSGVYFYKLSMNDFNATRRLLLLK